MTGHSEAGTNCKACYRNVPNGEVPATDTPRRAFVSDAVCSIDETGEDVADGCTKVDAIFDLPQFDVLPFACSYDPVQRFRVRRAASHFVNERSLRARRWDPRRPSFIARTGAVDDVSQSHDK